MEADIALYDALNELKLVILTKTFRIWRSLFEPRLQLKTWLTKHTQLSIGINESVVILCYALVHPRVFERQAAEPHFLPVKLK